MFHAAHGRSRPLTTLHGDRDRDVHIRVIRAGDRELIGAVGHGGVVRVRRLTVDRHCFGDLQGALRSFLILYKTLVSQFHNIIKFRNILLH